MNIETKVKIILWSKVIAVIIAISALLWTATRPVVTTGIKTARVYLSPKLQAKAWNEAHKQVLENQIEEAQHQLEKVKPMSFHVVETAKAEFKEMTAAALEQKTPAVLVKPTELQLTKYLSGKGSPLAPYAGVLLEQEHWLKILSIANAESSLCKRVDPKRKTNCWGVGGVDLWDMGVSYTDSIRKMNGVLNSQPAQSKIKYSDMSIDQMNGIWNQPATNTWPSNNAALVAELTALK